MSGTVLDDIELIIEDVHGHNGGKPPSRDGDDGGGDDGGRDGNSPEPRGHGSRKYSTAVAVAMLSIVMFFMVLTAAFLVLRTEPQNLHTWAGIRLPRILWLNTCLLMASSATLELARRRLSMDESRGFHRMWALTTALGGLFVVGQVIAWRQLAAQGVYETSRMASGFFYVFTVLHAVHLLGGLCALLYVGWHKLDASRIGRPLAVEVASYYWHFMDGLWLFLLALLYFGQ